MGMAKIPRRDIMGKNYMAREKKKKKKKKRNKMTISKDNKKRKILSLLKLKDIKFVFIGDMEHYNPLLNSKTKHENHKSAEK